jgi:hypothetical protein
MFSVAISRNLTYIKANFCGISNSITRLETLKLCVYSFFFNILIKFICNIYIHSLRYRIVQKLFLVNQFPAEHSLCEEDTVLPPQVTEGTAVKKWHKRKNTAAECIQLCDAIHIVKQTESELSRVQGKIPNKVNAKLQSVLD